MLVLSRRVGEEIVINDNIRITVVAVKGDRIRLGIVARDVTVDRAEVLSAGNSSLTDRRSRKTSARRDVGRPALG